MAAWLETGPGTAAHATCSICGKTYEGIVHDVSRLGMHFIPGEDFRVLGLRCQNCGADFCSQCGKKHIKASFWSGWEKTRCPKCQELFSTGEVVSIAPWPVDSCWFCEGDMLMSDDRSADALRVLKHKTEYHPLIAIMAFSTQTTKGRRTIVTTKKITVPIPRCARCAEIHSKVTSLRSSVEKGPRVLGAILFSLSPIVCLASVGLASNIGDVAMGVGLALAIAMAVGGYILMERARRTGAGAVHEMLQSAGTKDLPWGLEFQGVKVHEQDGWGFQGWK